MSGPLEIREEPFGLRHYLEGRAVHAGAVLELALESGVWVAGQYEWTFEWNDLATLYVPLAGPGRPQAVITLPLGAILRWPGG